MGFRAGIIHFRLQVILYGFYYYYEPEFTLGWLLWWLHYLNGIYIDLIYLIAVSISVLGRIPH
jgi:hypothetical protein